MDRVTFAELWRDTIATSHARFGDFLLVAVVADLAPSVIMRNAFPELSDGSITRVVPVAYWALLIPSIAAYLLGMFAIADAAITKDRGRLVLVSRRRLATLGKSILTGFVTLACIAIACLVLLLVVGLVALAVDAVAAGGTPEMATGDRARWLVPLVCIPAFGWVTARLAPLTGVLLSESLGVADSLERALGLSRGATLPLFALTVIFAAGSSILPGVLRAANGSIGQSIALEIGVLSLGAVIFIYGSAFAGVAYRRLQANESLRQSSGTLGAALVG
jgi:hypothetical protein